MSAFLKATTINNYDPAGICDITSHNIDLDGL